MKIRSWPVIVGVSVNQCLEDGGDLIVTANVDPNPHYPSCRVMLFETPGSCPVDGDGQPDPRVACGMTAHKARVLAGQLMMAADAVDLACPDDVVEPF
jgi:hypothetical protein